MRTICPSCQSALTVRNGRIHTGKQNRKCKACGRQFVEDPEKVFIPQEKWELVDRLLLEKLPIAGIARAIQIAESWVQEYVKRKYAQVPQQVEVIPKKRRLRVQMDEMWSFVGSKRVKVWIWLAQDEENREVVGCAMGDRSAETAQEPWDSLPPIYRQCALIHTDFWEAYAKILSSKRYKAVGKKTGKTCYIERLNNTFHQRISRLVRKTFSFSKKLEHHKAAIWNFIHHDNASLRPSLLR